MSIWRGWCYELAIVGSAVVVVNGARTLDGKQLAYQDVLVVIRSREGDRPTAQVMVMVTSEDERGGATASFVGVKTTVREAVEGCVAEAKTRGYPMDAVYSAVVQAELEYVRQCPPLYWSARRRMRLEALVERRDESC